MALKDLKTNLKSLKFGKDRPGGGSSNQPYIQKSIPDGDQPGIFSTGGPDFLLRGGMIAPVRAATDVSRLTQMFFDFKSPKGTLFTAKENLLSRTAVKTEASTGIGYGGGAVNSGIYNPLSTIAQAGVSHAGGHLNHLGLNPASPMSGVVEGELFPGTGLNLYEGFVKRNNEDGNNRLLNLHTLNQENSSVSNFNFQKGLDLNTGTNLMEYGGGPGSILGVGKTSIRYSDQRTGKNNVKGNEIVEGTYQTSRWSVRTQDSWISPITNGASGKYLDLTGGNLFNNPLTFPNSIPVITEDGGYTFNPNFEYNVYGSGSGWLKPTSIQSSNNSHTFTQEQIINKEGVNQGEQSKLYPSDFREELITPDIKQAEVSSVLSLSPNYKTKNIHIRVNAGDPGKSNTEDNKNIYNYGIPADEAWALDKITALPMYEDTNSDTDQAINDLIQFRIAAINNNRSDNSAVYMHFRAFLDSFNDSYNANWNPVNYVGRGDTLFNYNGFGRNINLSFTVAAQSKAELIPMYKKLNYLASTLAPDYTGAGFMRGNLIRLTVGGYVYEQPGFITQLTYDIPQESPWEIMINEEGGADSSVKELPHIINVSSFSFTPIHTFLPQKPNTANNPNEKYITLGNKFSSNYRDSYRTYKVSS